jgi:hypothetical protein
VHLKTQSAAALFYFAPHGSLMMHNRLFVFTVFTLSSPTPILPRRTPAPELHRYITTDFKQLQHAGIFYFLMVAGTVQILFGFRLLVSPAWNILWWLNCSFMGLLFLTHPQAMMHNSAQHTFLGTFLVYAPFFMMLVKVIISSAAR